MGKPTTQNNSFISHFSHPHRLQLTPATSLPPCSACKLSGGNGRVYSCRPCNFSLHESCSKMNQVITHPSHPSHTLTLLVAPVYDGGYFNCDGCGLIGTGFSYQCSRCDFDIHALCAYKPHSVIHKSHPQHNLKLAFRSHYGANKGFSCDICLKIGKNQWLYRCIPCEFDAHVSCISAPQPHLLQNSSSAPTPHAHHSGHPQHQNSLPVAANQGINRPRPRPMTRPNGPIGNPNRPNGPIGNPNRHMAQNVAACGPRGQNNKLGYNGQVGPIGPIGQVEVGQSFGQGLMDGSVYDGSAGNEEFDGEVDVEIEYEVDVYEATEDGEAIDDGQDIDANGLEIVDYGDGDDAACSESDFGGSSDARSQCNDLSDPADLYPLSVRTNQGSNGGRKRNPNPNGPAARSKNMGPNGPRGGLQGSKNPIRNPKGPQPRRVQNAHNNAGAGGPVRINRPRDLAVGPQGFNGPSGGPCNVIDSAGNNDNYNQVDGTEMYGGDYEESYGDDYAGGNGDCDFEVEGDYVDDGDDQAYDDTYGENDFENYSDITGGSESMYDGDESYGTMDESQYSGLNDDPNNQYLPMVGPVGGPGMNNQNQYGQPGRPRNMGMYGRGGTTNMSRNGNMNQGANSSQPRAMGRTVQYRPNGGPNRANRGPNGPNGGPNGPNGPNGKIVMNTTVQGLCEGFAKNMLIGDGGDVNEGAGDGGGDVNDGAGDGGGDVNEGAGDGGGDVYEGAGDGGGDVYEGAGDGGGDVIEGASGGGGSSIMALMGELLGGL